MKFILPRIFGLAIIAGIAAVVLAMVFKLMIGVSIILLIGYFIKNKFMRGRHSQHGMMQYANRHGEQQYGYNPFQQQYGQHYQNNDVIPVYTNQRSSGIIPIN